VAFQTQVVAAAFPQFKVKPYLCLVDKSHPVEEAATLSNFLLQRDPAQPKSRPTVSYRGDFAALGRSRVTVTLDVAAEVEKVRVDVAERAHQLVALLDAQGRVRRVQEDVTNHYRFCRACEFRVQGVTPDGFR